MFVSELSFGKMALACRNSRVGCTCVFLVVDLKGRHFIRIKRRLSVCRVHLEDKPTY